MKSLNEQTINRLQKLAGINEIKVNAPLDKVEVLLHDDISFEELGERLIDGRWSPCDIRIRGRKYSNFKLSLDFVELYQIVIFFVFPYSDFENDSLEEVSNLKMALKDFATEIRDKKHRNRLLIEFAGKDMGNVFYKGHAFSEFGEEYLNQFLPFE